MPLSDQFPSTRAQMEGAKPIVERVDDQCDYARHAFLIQREAADLLRLSPRTLERLRMDGTGPRFAKAGRRVLYRRTDLEDWVKQRIYQSTSQADAAGR